MKVLFYATYPDQPIGYSKVANVLSNYFASFPNIELVYMGIANYPSLAVKHRYIDPRIRFIDVLALEKAKGSTEEYGVDLIQEILEQESPDVFFLYNDIIVTCRLFNQLAEYRKLHSTKFVCYLDLVYPYERAEFIRHMDRHTDLIFVFSECWRKNLISMNVRSQKLRVLPHGFNDTLLYPLSNEKKEEARKQFGFSFDDFIFLNTNRNTYRKAQDITIGGFLYCLKKSKMDPRLKLFLNCSLKTNNGYDISDIVEVECMKRGLPLSEVQQRIRTFPKSQAGQVSDETINTLYNVTDVGVNSCTGEGFGLCSMEHAALGIPQIVSAVGALQDIFADGGAILIEPRAVLHTPRCLDEHTGEQGICSAEDFGEAMYQLFQDKSLYNKHATWLQEHMKERYKWSSILQQFQKDFNTFFAENP